MPTVFPSSEHLIVEFITEICYIELTGKLTKRPMEYWQARCKRDIQKDMSLRDQSDPGFWFKFSKCRISFHMKNQIDCSHMQLFIQFYMLTILLHIFLTYNYLCHNNLINIS